MKKLILSSILLGAGAFSASAVSPFFEFMPVIAGDDYTAFNFQGGIKADVHPNIALGLGVGITEEWNFKHGPLLPIFGRAEFSGRLGSLNPFFSFDVGYEINTECTECGAVLVNPMVGLKFGNWYGGIGYLGHCWTQSGSGSTSCFNMKIGYNF
ncbi:MAG: hypothetical protein K2I37_04565 [Muribaculaceae bacterium]|nr:hypothetical protein [Muribaculaceae bacterium]